VRACLPASLRRCILSCIVSLLIKFERVLSCVSSLHASSRFEFASVSILIPSVRCSAAASFLPALTADELEAEQKDKGKDKDKQRLESKAVRGQHGRPVGPLFAAFALPC
jgi:hypothetical protein